MINVGCWRADCRGCIYIASARQHYALIKDNSPQRKIIAILTRLINKWLHFKTFSSGLIFGGHECLCTTSHFDATFYTCVISFTVNYYCLFANRGVSIRFIGKDDNVVLEWAVNDM